MRGKREKIKKRKTERHSLTNDLRGTCKHITENTKTTNICFLMKKSIYVLKFVNSRGGCGVRHEEEKKKSDGHRYTIFAYIYRMRDR